MVSVFLVFAALVVVVGGVGVPVTRIAKDLVQEGTAFTETDQSPQVQGGLLVTTKFDRNQGPQVQRSTIITKNAKDQSPQMQGGSTFIAKFDRDPGLQQRGSPLIAKIDEDQSPQTHDPSAIISNDSDREPQNQTSPNNTKLSTDQTHNAQGSSIPKKILNLPQAQESPIFTTPLQNGQSSSYAKEINPKVLESPIITKIAPSVNRTANKTVKLDKCCPKGETLGNSERTCVPSPHRLLHPFRPPPIYKRPGVPTKNTTTYSLSYGILPKCRLLYFLEPDREPADVFWLLESGTVVRAGEEPLKRGKYCLEAIPSKEAVLPVLCFPEGGEEGVGVYAVYPVGMLVSIPFLASTLLVYSIFRELYNLHGRCLMCHVSCLLLAYLILATIQVDTTAFPYYMCCIMGYAIQFFFMATFFWLNVMCFDIYWAFSGLRNLTGSVKERERKKLILYSCYAWGVPLFILLLTVGMDYSPYVPNDSIFKPAVGIDKCFFQKDIATGIYFYMPMGFVLLMNIVLFSITAFRICSLRRETAVLKRGDSRKHDSTNDKESVTDLQTKFLENKKTPIASSGLMIDATKEPYIVKNIRFSLYLKLFLVMGINWVMELVSYLAGGPSYIWYIPDFTNTLQGVFIFIIFVWKERVRRLVWAKITSCCGCKVVSNPSRGQWTTSTRNTNSITNSSGITSNSIKMAPMPLTETNGVDNGVSNGMSNGMSNGGINNDRNVDANNAPPQGLA